MQLGLPADQVWYVILLAQAGHESPRVAQQFDRFIFALEPAQHGGALLARAELSKCRGLIGRTSTAPVSGQQLQDAERQFADICKRVNSSPASDPMLLDRRRVLWDLLEIQRARARGASATPAFSLAQVQAALATDEAVIYHYWLDATTLLSVALNRDMHRSHLTTHDPATVKALRDYAHYVLNYKRESPQSWLEKGIVRHAGRLLPETLAPVLEGKRRLIISPHRMLHSIPYHVLPWGQHRHLIQGFAISYAPNLTSLLIRHAPPIPRRVFAVGVRDYHVPGLSLSPLPAALADVAAAKSAWSQEGIPVTTLPEEKATEAELELLATSGELARFSHLHFAVHGANVEGDTPMESRLYLRDSALDGLEISRWRLNAELVVLGACYSGQRPFAGRHLDELPGDDMFGLAAAFFAAGARRMLGALWMADDATAARVNAAIHHDLARGAAPEIALQSAQAAEITRGSTVYAWAPYFLSTLGRALP